MDEYDILNEVMTDINRILPKIRSELVKAGFKVIKVHDGDLDTDPSLELEHGFSLDITEDRTYSVCQEIGGKFRFSPELKTLAEAIRYLKTKFPKSKK